MNKKIFVMLTLPKFTSNSTENPDNLLTPNIPIALSRTMFSVLMVQHTHYPDLKPDPKTGNAHQGNAIVSYIRDQKFEVKGTVLEDFKKLVAKFCALLWEIYSHYYKIKARGCSFPNIIEKYFLSFSFFLLKKKCIYRRNLKILVITFDLLKILSTPELSRKIF